ncbi:hypothetical protein [Qipengyuania spongiae]|uniref:N-(5'-phosphoribosyl)anthranilate isomerase n=1 Tax=Qipengyuania spongiae TaxID=2909673 RepID=A0ABY5SVM1_9SPHN|nr:hypothetical protein [Qipengyuania spongiae]UVI38608.1 hypothetical protein L1F33_10140 [Qipengyuania spongiae]
MSAFTRAPSAHFWISQIFSSQAACNGGIVRRKIASVVEYASVALLKAEVIRRGFHMVESGDQFVIFCNPGDIKIVA